MNGSTEGREQEKEIPCSGPNVGRLARRNFCRLDYGYYIVRTQAGFKQAIKDFNEEAFKDGDTEFMSYPKTYPSVVKFRIDYNMGIILTHNEHVKKAVSGFERILDVLRIS